MSVAIVNQVNRFVLQQDTPVRILLRQASGLAVEDCNYEIGDATGKPFMKGNTGTTGMVQADLPAAWKEATLKVWLEGPTQAPEEWILALGELEPIDDIRGVQGRLANLGFEIPDDEYGVNGPRTREAVRAFEEFVGMTSIQQQLDTMGEYTTSSNITDEVRRKLNEVYELKAGLHFGAEIEAIPEDVVE
jgi:peptidoglycan hydrolase-like protein with peptidoglycan-binding domain